MDPPSKMSASLSAAELAGGPGLYPQKVSPDFDALFLVRMDRERYRAASFLDDRLLEAAPAVGWVPLAPVAMAARQIKPRPLHFIFHAGHVGSTLLSRLLDEVPGVLGLREPLPLRSLAGLQDRGSADFASLLATFLALWSRGFADTGCVILKATSSTGRLAPELMARLPESRATYLGLAAEAYICTLLAGANALGDLEGLTPERLDRLERLLGERADAAGPLSLGEGAALAWLVERFAQARAVQALGPRLLALNFDAFLADPAAALTSVLAHFSLPPEEAGRLAQSPLWGRYSKAPDHAYSLDLRQASLDQARREQGEEIRRGLDFLSRMGARHGAVAALL
jgi:hypothetical protein